MSYTISFFITKLSIFTGLGEDSSENLLFLVKHHDHTLVSVLLLFPALPSISPIDIVTPSIPFFFVPFCLPLFSFFLSD